MMDEDEKKVRFVLWAIHKSSVVFGLSALFSFSGFGF